MLLVSGVMTLSLSCDKKMGKKDGSGKLERIFCVGFVYECSCNELESISNVIAWKIMLLKIERRKKITRCFVRKCLVVLIYCLLLIYMSKYFNS